MNDTPARVNIKWKPGRAKEGRDFIGSKALRTVPGYELLAEIGWEVYELPPGLAKKPIEWLLQHPCVEAAEPEGFGEAIPFDPTDGGFSSSVDQVNEWWQVFVRAAQAHFVTAGGGAVGAILDNGLNPDPWTDPHIIESKLFRITETNGTLGGSHGQPVTGCAIGIAPNAKHTNYKIATSADVKCSWTDVSTALLYAKQQGIKIANISYGGGSSLTLQSTLATCKQAGMAIFVAAGNSGTATQFPASNPNVYAVSSVATSGEISGFSCRGKINIAAPGEQLLTRTNSQEWASFSGTSGASPIAYGCCLLVSSANPTWSGVQCADYLLSRATPKLPVENYGAGWVDAASGVGLPAIEPPPPTMPEAPFIIELTSTRVKFGWNTAGNYELIQGAGYKFDQVGMATLSYTWNYLKPGIDYRVALRANGLTGPWTAFKTPLTDTPPPPTDETWITKTEFLRTDVGPYSPSTVTQARQTTDVYRVYELSNLGNIRNDHTESVAGPDQTRDLSLPTA
jgi:hypothetical protein